MSEQQKNAEFVGKLTAWFQVNLPGVQQLEVGNFTSPKIGYSSETMLFDLRVQRNGEEFTERLVIRLEPKGTALFSRYDLKLQFRIMNALPDSDVPVPRMRWFEEDPALFNSPFYIMDHVAGEIPADNPPYHGEGWLKEQAPERRRQIWLNAVTAMAKIHRLNYREFDLEFLDEPELGPTPIEQHINLYERHIDWGLERQRFPLLDTAFALAAQQPACP